MFEAFRRCKPMDLGGSRPTFLRKFSVPIHNKPSKRFSRPSGIERRSIAFMGSRIGIIHFLELLVGVNGPSNKKYAISAVIHGG